jgi:hypothetical protein
MTQKLTVSTLVQIVVCGMITWTIPMRTHKLV